MPKPLRLKRTPEERARRKAARAARKSRREGSRKKHPETEDHDVYGPSPSSHKPDLEETHFREKLWDALGDDEGLDGVNARFNDYAHIPDRWSRDKHDAANPQYMDDDEYAEWLREGMWKRKHAREYEEQAKRDAEKAAQRARQKEIKAETARIERAALEREESRRKERRRQQEEEYRQQYEHRWKALLDPRTRDHGPLTFGDIPWPLFLARHEGRRVSRAELHVEDITPEAISAFILPDVNGTTSPGKGDDVSRRNRDKLKETLLRFHPDKFNGRFMHRVSASDVESVREAVAQVARVLNVLLSGQS